MTFRMLFAIVLLKLVANAFAHAHYTQYQNVNAFDDQFAGNKGANHLEHCEKSRTLDECQNLCDMDCECHCVVVYMGPTDAEYGSGSRPCFMRRDCNPPFTESDPSFDVYVKNGSSNSSDCSVYEDLGFESTCAGGTDPKTVTNVGSLQECKAVCTLLSFECVAIDYKSMCTNTAQDQCIIYTGGDITVTPTAAVKANNVIVEAHHCLKYNGTVGNLSGHLMVPLFVTVNGVDPSLVMANPAREHVGNLIKTIIANQHSSLDETQIVVLLSNSGSVNVTAEIEILVHSATDFKDVRETLIGHASTLSSTIINDLTQLDDNASLPNIGDGPFTITDMLFNLTKAEFRTTVTTTEEPNSTAAPATTIQVSGAHQLRMLGVMFMWILAAQHIFF